MQIRSLVPLLASAGILLGANGLLGTLVAVRAHQEGFSDPLIGLLGSGYFLGYFGGSLFTAALIARAGHIRVFAALSALSAIIVLTMILMIDPLVWLAVRVLGGFSFSGISLVIESWLNERAASEDRARVLSLYRIVDLTSVTGGQFLLPLFGAGSFAIFAVCAILFAGALIPVSLSRLGDPAPPATTRLRPGRIWAVSQVACVGCITLGLTNGAFRSIGGPLYAQGMGLDVDGVALFMSLGIFGGAISQYPLGWLSDRVDRRFALLLATGGAVAASLLLALFAPGFPALVFVGGLLFGSFAMPLYSLSIAHANDFAEPGTYVELAAGLTMFYAIGASVGPLIASFLIGAFGPAVFFLYTSALHGGLIVFVVFRMTRRAPVPAPLRERFVGLVRTSPALFGLARPPGEPNRRSRKDASS